MCLKINRLMKQSKERRRERERSGNEQLDF